ncbi:hypothetical protein [Puerhibacterium puerhi]|uniref:hypothetical protein n=1 Tax=Puerhibacterium puerhi TaxID=2692623 RepID=UPI00135A73A5|nr:hypothetical protein [Puerhibacterium puerhi]
MTSAAPEVEWRIEGTWLVEVANEHTCGTGPHGHYGAHEPGCGLVPIQDLSQLDGFAELLERARADGARGALLSARAGLERAMLGTTDGDLISPDSDVPAGEMYRLAAEHIASRAEAVAEGL